MREFKNEGVYMPGGTISNSVVAGGRGAVAKLELVGRALEEHGTAELAACVRDLERALVTDADRLGDASQSVQEQAESLAEELANQPPRKSVVLRLLKGIAEDASAVASIVNAALALMDAVQRVLH
jgi:hypothetical protein